MRRNELRPSLFLCLLVAAGCMSAGTKDAPLEAPDAPRPNGKTPAIAGDGAPGKDVVTSPQAAEQAPAASVRLGDDALPAVDKLMGAIRSHFERNAGRRVYVQIDKPVYQPGETLWIRTWDLQSRDLAGEGGGGGGAGILYELVSPKGAVVRKKRVRQTAGSATNDFVIPEEAQGGEYTLRATADDGARADRPVIVSNYEPPRIKKKLEFVRKAYGAGDEVTATIEIKRPTGEPLGEHPLTALVRLDGQDLPRVSFTTNAEGGGLVRFKLPAQIALGDGLLTVLVKDGGITESISKRVPIVLKKVQLSFFPEGGSLVEGIPSRVYIEAKNTLGKPADVEGRVVDDHGATVARFATFDRGLGRLDLSPSTGRTYHAEVTRPVGVTERYPLPLPAKSGCVMRTFDDVDGQAKALRVGVRCDAARNVIVAGVLRENLLDAAAVAVPAGGQAVVHLTPKDEALTRAQGAARVTVFDDKLSPLAERIVFRGRRNVLNVTVEPDEPSYSPREQVALTIRTTGAAGAAVPAELALAVVDDTVISFADDKTGHLLSKLLLEPEIPGDIEEPNFYFDLTEDKSALGMELLMGTRGWRRFEWRPVFEPPRPSGSPATGVRIGGAPMMRPAREGEMENGMIALEGEDEGEAEEEGGRRPVRRKAKKGKAKRAPMAKAPPPAPVMAKPQEAPARPAAIMQAPADNKRAKKRRRVRDEAKEQMADDVVMGVAAEPDWAPAAGPMGADKADRGFAERRRMPAYAPVRVFPAPDYSGTQGGTRTDFRETIHWAPSVKTDRNGKATITFFTSDSVTSFRVFAEGVGGGLAGRQEQVFKSNLPFSMNVKLPLEVSEGDVMELPLTLTNEQTAALPMSLAASFGDLLKLSKPVSLAGPALAPQARESLFYEVEVTGDRGQSEVKFAANAGGLTDEFVRKVNVQPLGFPQSIERSGALSDVVRQTIDLAGATEASIEASIKLYPSPVSTLLSGLSGLLREPSGCFEQTSSSNYPNVMVLSYLQAHDVADPALIQRTRRLLSKGYRKLVGFETKKKGYEWFGGVPAHEALTAYGLQEFADMRAVFGGVDEAMMTRTANWLKKRADGAGGFKRDKKALDSFGRASPKVTNAYVTYSLAEAGLAARFATEVDAQARLASATKDPYLLALAAGTLLSIPKHKAAGQSAAKRLAGMQDKAGHFPGADHSITRSGGVNLHIETTGLAVLALMQAGHDDAVRRAVTWLNDHRGGYGNWGATQATVLALKALTAYANRYRRTQSGGGLTVFVNGKQVGAMSYSAGRREPLEFTGLGKHLTRGQNVVEVRHTGTDELPWSLAVDYRSVQPATHPKVVVELNTSLERDSLKMGETVRLNARLKNRTDKGQPMTLARVGLPGGLTFQNWQLKELREKGLISFYETRPREVILYFRDLAPGAEHDIPLDLVATVPGRYTGPASSAYLYYTADRRHWTEGLKVAVTR